MASTHELGPHFWSIVRLDMKSPRKFEATTYETSYPFRIAQSRITRVLNRGWVRGTWELDPVITEADDIEEGIIQHLYNAINCVQAPVRKTRVRAAIDKLPKLPDAMTKDYDVFSAND